MSVNSLKFNDVGRTHDFLNRNGYYGSGNVSEQRAYAACVYRMQGNGEPVSPETILVTKIVLGILLLVAVYAFVRSRKNGEDLEWSVIEAITWSLKALVLMALMFTVVMAVLFIVF